MKAFAAVCALFVLSLVEGRSVEPSSPKHMFSPLQEECIKELKLDDNRADIGDFNNQAICPEDNPNYNKFISCFWKKTNRQTTNGEINYDTIKQFVREGIALAIGSDPVARQFAEENSVNIVKECKDITGETPEKKVVKVRNCIVRGLEAIGKN